MQTIFDRYNAALGAALFFSVLLFAVSPLHGQEIHPDLLKLPGSSTQANQTPVQGTLNIVAVMVEFQPDDNSFTSGNGTFSPGSLPYLEDPGTNIDPLPHDKAYFEAHLEFAKNYFERNSNGQFTIQYQVVDQVFRLPKEMKEYSPIGEDPSPLPLAEFAADVWETVNESGQVQLDFTTDSETAFIVFHAGVGRDIQLIGTTLDKTPQDIPSVYLSRNAISRLFDDPSFSGFPINNGDVLVENTLILPRTLSRAGEDISGNTFVLPLSINGMVTAQIASHIGLPDLFNTETGESGIGRFGLMDGAGIFAYNGLFPPELSAWEKIHLGWQQPFNVNPGSEQSFTLPAASLRDPNSIAKIPISVDEYFLVENRHRDIDNQGVTLTIRRPDGTTVDQHFTNQDTSFVFQLSGFADELEPGVVTNVSNFDFALPGGPVGAIDEFDEDRTLNGGILVWHIDEGVIRNQLSARAGINDNPDRRGVNLQEADGAQDIGRPTQIGITTNNPNGSAFDFWWSGNDATVITQTGEITLYENRFGPDTTPNNKSNSGAATPFELFEFSDILPTATFGVRPVEPGGGLYEVADATVLNPGLTYYTPADDPYWNRYPLSVISLGDRSKSIISTPQSIYYRVHQGDLQQLHQNNNLYQQPIFHSNSETVTLATKPLSGGQDIAVRTLERTGITFTEAWEFETPANRGLISSPSSDILQFDGTRARARISSQTIDENYYPDPVWRSEQINGFESSITNSGEVTITTPSAERTTQVSVPDLPFVRKHIGLIQQADGGYKTFLLLENDLYLFDNLSGGVERRTIHSSEKMDWPAIADIDKSGSADFLFVDRAENQLVAKNLNGAVLSGFPITPPPGVQFTGTPLVADIDGNGEFELIITGQDTYSMNLYAYRFNGTPVEQFPLLVGGVNSQEDDPVHPALGDQYLTAISHSGDLRVWRFPNMETILWESRYGNSGNNKLTGRQLTEPVSTPGFGVLNKAETYNWPNPATDHTYIRFQTEDAGEVRIRIATTSGRMIYDRTVETRGGLAEEIKIDTSGWGSGGYMAMVSATVNGRTERKMVKIAIAR